MAKCDITDHASFLPGRSLISELLLVMEETGADFTNTFRCLSRLPLPGSDAFQDCLSGVLRYLLTQCCTVQEMMTAFTSRSDPEYGHLSVPITHTRMLAHTHTIAGTYAYTLLSPQAHVKLYIVIRHIYILRSTLRSHTLFPFKHTGNYVLTSNHIQSFPYKQPHTVMSLQTTIYSHVLANNHIQSCPCKQPHTVMSLQTTMYSHVLANNHIQSCPCKQPCTVMSLQTTTYSHVLTNNHIQLCPYKQPYAVMSLQTTIYSHVLTNNHTSSCISSLHFIDSCHIF